MTLAAEADYSAEAANSNEPIKDEDRDSVHVLPLSIVPLQTKGLERTRMIKNAKLESVIELFDDKKAGSGQIPVNAVRQVFTNIDAGDVNVLSKLSKLYSTMSIAYASSCASWAFRLMTRTR